MTCHDPAPVAGGLTVEQHATRFALVGSPNAGKTTLFNALTGLRAKTGNYPGVTVTRYEGVADTNAGHQVLVEDLPGTYSLDPISPDELVVSEVLDPGEGSVATPDAIILAIDATTLGRSLGLVGQVLNAGLPACVVLTMTDELARRGGRVDVDGLSRALGVPVVPIVAGNSDGVATLRALMNGYQSWQAPAVPPPLDPAERHGWTTSVLQASGYQLPDVDERTRRIDNLLLHPLWGTLIFFAVMFAFFQTIFTLAAPLQDGFEGFFWWLGGLAAAHIQVGWLASFVGDALLGGIGGVVVFLPQIALLFLLISLLEGTGYMSRAALLMDRVMGRFGLEGRAFVALLSSVACAVPGIMATRSLPSAKDRIATMMGAPLMTCSARLPVYVMLISMLVPSEIRVGPLGAQGLVMFVLYLLGALLAMLSAWAFKTFLGRTGDQLPFYMEMPSYRLPSLRSVGLSVWDSCKAFLRKVATVILAASAVLWVLLNFPLHSDSQLAAAGVDVRDEAAVAAFTVENSFAAEIGHAMSPVFEPLGFDWRVNVGVLSSLAAREVFVATMGQISAAADPEDPQANLATMVWTEGERAGEPVFTSPTVAALLMFYAVALMCMATVAAMRRETGTWKWPAIAFAYMFALAWVLAFATRHIVAVLL